MSFPAGFPIRVVALSSNNMNSNSQVLSVAVKQILYLQICNEKSIYLFVGSIIEHSGKSEI